MPTSERPADRRFIYRGNAIPLGGQVYRVGEKRVSKSIASPAASSLTVVGGASHSTVAGSTFEDIFSWGDCLADSSGAVNAKGSAVTTVTARIKNFRARNKPIVFETDLLGVTVVSDHPVRGQPSIAPTEVAFYKKKMTFNKLPVTLDVDLNTFQTLATLESLDREFRTNRKFFDSYVGRFRRKRSSPPSFGSSIPRISGYVSCSIVSGITWGDRKIPGNVLQLDGFGSIYFGEMLINEYNRRLTLVRLRMGSDVEADTALAEVDPNGSWE
jgi:hypothetical protein